jgi:hypothetical protein
MLHLPKARKLESLTVRLLGRQDINFGDLRASESSISLDKEITLDVGQGKLFDKGEHLLHFRIIIPSSTACFERCNWGRVKHTVTATAKGLGHLGGDVVSPAVRLSLVVNVSLFRSLFRHISLMVLLFQPGGAGASEPPPSFSQRHEGVGQDIGPYTMSLRSQHVMVRAYFRSHF